MSNRQDIKASLPLQIAYYFNRYYSALFTLIMFLTFIYKGILLPYPPNAIGLETAFIFLYIIIEWIRLRLLTRGNRMESVPTLLGSIILAVPVIIFHVYYLRLQTYVLRLEQVINSISLVFVCFEVVLSVVTGVRFIEAQRF